MSAPQEPRKMTTSRPKLAGWVAIRARDRQALAEMAGRPFTVPEFCGRVARLLSENPGVEKTHGGVPWARMAAEDAKANSLDRR